MHVYLDDYKAAVWAADEYCDCSAAQRNQHAPDCPWLTPNERLVALAHTFYAAWVDGEDCRPGAGKIAQRTGLSARSVYEIRASLVRKGWMRLEHQGGAPMGSRREANVYALTIPDTFTPRSSFTGEDASPVKAGALTPEAAAPTPEAGGEPPPKTSYDHLQDSTSGDRTIAEWLKQDHEHRDDDAPLDPFEADLARARAASASPPRRRGALGPVALRGDRIEGAGPLAELLGAALASVPHQEVAVDVS